MPDLPRYLALGSHVAVQRPLGGVEVMTTEAYAALPEAAVAGTLARLLTRREAIALRQAERLRRVA